MRRGALCAFIDAEHALDIDGWPIVDALEDRERPPVIVGGCVIADPSASPVLLPLLAVLRRRRTR